MKTDFKHNLKVEERIFHLDVAALCGYDEGFKAAYENGENYELGIKLNQLFLICPRKRQRKQQYERLVRFLALKHITLRITSRKHEKEKVIYNQVKYQSSVNQNNIGERFTGF